MAERCFRQNDNLTMMYNNSFHTYAYTCIHTSIHMYVYVYLHIHNTCIKSSKSYNDIGRYMNVNIHRTKFFKNKFQIRTFFTNKPSEESTEKTKPLLIIFEFKLVLGIYYPKHNFEDFREHPSKDIRLNGLNCFGWTS